jgi:hypothetical protein
MTPLDYLTVELTIFNENILFEIVPFLFMYPLKFYKQILIVVGKESPT